MPPPQPKRKNLILVLPTAQKKTSSQATNYTYSESLLHHSLVGFALAVFWDSFPHPPPAHHSISPFPQKGYIIKTGKQQIGKWNIKEQCSIWEPKNIIQMALCKG